MTIYTTGFGDPGTLAAWEAPGGCTFVLDGTHAHSSTSAALMTVTGSPTTAFDRIRFAVSPGSTYSCSLWVFQTSTATGPRATIDWRDSTGSIISSVSSTSVSVVANTYTQLTVSAVAPDTAAFASFGPTLSSSPTTGRQMWVDDMTVDGPLLTVTPDGNWPPRNQIVVEGIQATDVVTVFRSTGGVRTPVRGLDAVMAGDTTIVRNDAEYSFGAPITYVLNVNGADVTPTVVLTPTLEGGNVALTDAITGLAVETQIFAWPDHQNDRTGTKFVVGGQTVFVGAPRGGSDNQVKFATMTDSSRDQMIALLKGATAGIILLRVPDVTVFPGYDGHYVMTADDEQPWTQRGSDQRRFFTLSLSESAAWADGLLATASTLADIELAYSGASLGDIQTAFTGMDLLDLEVRDWHNEGAL